MRKFVAMESFALRQFDPVKKYCFIDYPAKEFEDQINALCSPEDLVDGYAPFCKHLFMENFTSATLGYVKLEADTPVLTEYVARRPNELAVLNRWTPEATAAPVRAQYLDVILYSREQILKENAAMKEASAEFSAPWGIISIKPQHCTREIPMEPITMMRNALPIEEGGSGTPLDKKAYAASVEFWSQHVKIA